jgi:hypothetical protein
MLPSIKVELRLSWSVVRCIFLNKDLLISGLYYKHTTMVNYASSIVNKLEALLNDYARVIICDRHVFIVQATDQADLSLQ